MTESNDENWDAAESLLAEFFFGPEGADSEAFERLCAKHAELAPELTEVETPVGSALLLTADLPLLAAGPSAVDTVRLLPSGDTYYLLHGSDRTLLVPDAANREQLWTSRVWPGAVLVSGQVVGTWRRAKGRVSIHPWRRLAAGEQEAVASEAESLPIPDVGRITVTWT